MFVFEYDESVPISAVSVSTHDFSHQRPVAKHITVHEKLSLTKLNSDTVNQTIASPLCYLHSWQVVGEAALNDKFCLPYINSVAHWQYSELNNAAFSLYLFNNCGIF